MLKLQEKIINRLIKHLWLNYKNKVQQVKKIENTIRAEGDHWSEDHLAFRTLPGSFCGLHILQEIFEILGYSKADEYHFKDKKLNAISMNPPNDKLQHSSKVPPKIFISVLEPESFSQEFQKCILKYTEDLENSPVNKLKSEFLALKSKPENIDAFVESLTLFLSNGPVWRTPSFKDYELLRKESEYAAWTLVYGNTPNHFTVSIHLMKKFKTLKNFNQFIQKELGISMNTAGGGIIKGSAEVQLEQSATLAEELLVPFQDGFRKIPYAFVEFAFRHPLLGKKRDGIWCSYYQGFVTDNADKIFESTNLRKQA
ncbi:DUF1338 domain-containing protein [Fluviispira multicolorata]|uniref:2-oxoadipate dioxygenase/decarboxylase n=1 Tax=Fluviispira multicolorata TaxID=2654512 RepID=A0A833N462_9BACT|nr:DUF1338 domain-containing protein [Fluviispira multicolorata]KAB8029941.1 DUF1338 family protein [Fluviispira multicolorata]